MRRRRMQSDKSQHQVIFSSRQVTSNDDFCCQTLRVGGKLARRNRVVDSLPARSGRTRASQAKQDLSRRIESSRLIVFQRLIYSIHTESTGRFIADAVALNATFFHQKPLKSSHANKNDIYRMDQITSPLRALVSAALSDRCIKQRINLYLSLALIIPLVTQQKQIVDKSHTHESSDQEFQHTQNVVSSLGEEHFTGTRTITEVKTRKVNETNERSLDLHEIFLFLPLVRF